MTQKQVGNKHVKEVTKSLLKLINGISIKPSSPENLTALYIFSKHHKIENVQCKFDFESPDNYPDLKITSNDNIVNYHLFMLKRNNPIQAKNPGAKSFISKYFNDSNFQFFFNKKMEYLILLFYKEFINSKAEYTSIKEFRKYIKERNIKFSNNKKAAKARKHFLYSLREMAFNSFQDLLNNDKKDFLINGLNSLLFNGESMIVFISKKDNYSISEFSCKLVSTNMFEMYRKGNDSIAFTDGKVEILLRFKFESQPDSSIKLSVSINEFKSPLNQNKALIHRFEESWKEIVNNVPSRRKNIPNSIGKVNEVLIYHYLIENHPSIIVGEEIDKSKHINILKQHANNLSKNILLELDLSAKNAVNNVLIPHIKTENPEFLISSITFTDDAYRLDMRDNSDIKITLKSKDNSFIKEIGYSLKTNARVSASAVIKNPGFGKILGPQYFNVGDTIKFNEQLKEEFKKGKLNRDAVLESANNYIVENLHKAPLENLNRGITIILGEVNTLHTYYKNNSAKIYEAITCSGNIKFKKNTPTSRNNTLSWNSEKEHLIMRVKFSKGKKHGWSSLKLACTYKKSK